MTPLQAKAWTLLGLAVASLYMGCRPSVSSDLPLATAELPLVFEKAISHPIKSGESHGYPLALEPGQVVEASVEQQSIDVALLLDDPEQTTLIRMDSPSGTEGFEQLVFVAQRRGDHRLLIKASDGPYSGGEGTYVLRVRKPRPAQPRDQKTADALAEMIRCEEERKKQTEEGGRRALLHCSNAFDLWKELGNQDQQAVALNRRGRIHAYLGESSQAVELYQWALSLATDRKERVLILNRLALAYADLGRISKAREAGEQALALAPEAGPVLLAGALNNLSVIYRNWGEIDKAEEFSLRALEAWDSTDPHPDRVQSLLNLANIHLSIGSPESALDYLKEVGAVQRQFGGVQHETYRFIGVALDQMGNRPARGFLELARSHAHVAGERWAETQALNDLGTHLLATGDWAEARAVFTEALEIARSTQNDPGAAYAIGGLGEALLEGGDASGALQSLVNAESRYQKIGDPSGLVAVLYRKALAERKLGRIEDSLGSIDRALELVELLRKDVGARDLRVEFVGIRTDLYDLRVDLLMSLHERSPDQGYAARAFQASEWRRARSLLETVREMGVSIPENISRDALRQQGFLRTRLQHLAEERIRFEAGLSAGEGRSLSQVNQEIREAVAQWEVLAEDIRRENPAYSALTEPKIVGVPEVQEMLDGDTALLAITLGEKRSILWWIEKDAFEVRMLDPGAKLERLAQLAYERISHSSGRKQNRPEREVLEELGQSVLEPVADRLKSVRHLVIVADGALQSLPFSTFQSPDSGEPLVESHSVAQLPSASLGLALRERNRPAWSGLLAIFADPVFDFSDPRFHGTARPGQPPANLVRLPFSEKEAQAILKMVPKGESLRFLGFDARRDAALRPDLSKQQYIHFATHGIVDLRNPNLSGIQLSRIDAQGRLEEGGGLLPFYEVYNLSLPADLVTLSACKSAVGPHVRGEGYLGMSRSFLYAGASRVVGALWDVNDEAAAELMILFYRGLIVDGKPPAVALQEAQRAMRAQERWQSPYYWAGFVLQGDWR